MLFHILTIVFVVLKLTGVITWSWLLVLLPSILVVCFAVLGILIGGSISALVLWKALRSKKR